MDLESSQRAVLVASAKRRIRARMRGLRVKLPARARAVRSAAIVAAVVAHPAWKQARRIALFAPLLDRGEVDVRALDGAARSEGRRLYYPGFDAVGQPCLAETDLTALAPGARGFDEPPPDAVAAAACEVDLAIVPALAVDGACYRIGYGSGYYDALLVGSHRPKASLVVAFHFQLLGEVPRDEHDAPCDWVVTDEVVVARGEEQEP